MWREWGVKAFFGVMISIGVLALVAMVWVWGWAPRRVDVKEAFKAHVRGKQGVRVVDHVVCDTDAVGVWQCAGMLEGGVVVMGRCEGHTRRGLFCQEGK